MSRFSDLRISSGGKLLADEWIYNEETKRGRMERGVDVTDKALFHLTQECSIEDDVVFKDILMLLESMDIYPFLSPLFTHGPWLKGLVDEGLIPNLFDTEAPVDKIIIGWSCALQDDLYDDRSVLESCVNVYGVRNDSDETYALDFTPLYELADCKVILDDKVDIHDERKVTMEPRRKYLDSLSDEERGKESYYPIMTETHKSFTLFEILYGLFWEFSFHGGPENREEKLEELKETMRRIDSGEEKLIPWEDVKNNLKQRLKSDDE